MPRCVTNWEQRTAAAPAAGKAMHIHKTSVGPPLPFSFSFFLIFSLFPFLSFSFSLYRHYYKHTTVRGKPAFTRGTVKHSSRAEETLNNLGKLIPPSSFSSLIIERQCCGQCVRCKSLTDFFDNKTGNFSRITTVIFHCRGFKPNVRLFLIY